MLETADANQEAGKICMIIRMHITPFASLNLSSSTMICGANHIGHRVSEKLPLSWGSLHD